MAEIANTRVEKLYTAAALSANDTSEPVSSSNGGFLAGAVQVVAGGGSGFNGGTVTVQVSLDKVNWFTAKNVAGSDMTLTADGYFEFCLAAQHIRVLCDGSISDVDASFFLA